MFSFKPTRVIKCLNILAGSIHENGGAHTHGGVSHSHDHGSHDHGHTHEVMDSPGKYIERDRPVYRTDWNEVQ